jgi:UDP-glucose 4-epimerase
MKWLITGGCGFIGTSLIGQLVGEEGHAIRVLDNLSVGTQEDLAKVCEFSLRKTSEEFPDTGVELVVGDILDHSFALQVTRGADVIVHLAANTGVGPSLEDPRGDCFANVVGTLNYLDGARSNAGKRFVFASSGAPIGECKPPIHEELPAHPVSPYGASKLAGEGYCSAYNNSFGIETVALRFGNVYGPGSGHKNSVVAKFIKQAMAGEPLEIYGDGKQTRDFIYIDDLVRAINLAVVKDSVGGEVFQIATNRETTIGGMVDILIPILAEAGIENVSVIYGEKRMGDVVRNFSDTNKAKERLDWICNVSLDEGLKLTVCSFLKSLMR